MKLYRVSYQVSFIDSWLLCRPPIKRFLLWTMKKPNNHESKDTLEKHTVYSFGDHYYFRKELQILNLLTGLKAFLYSIIFLYSEVISYK